FSDWVSSDYSWSDVVSESTLSSLSFAHAVNPPSNMILTNKINNFLINLLLLVVFDNRKAIRMQQSVHCTSLLVIERIFSLHMLKTVYAHRIHNVKYVSCVTCNMINKSLPFFPVGVYDCLLQKNSFISYVRNVYDSA